MRVSILLRQFAGQVKVVRRVMQGVLALAWKNGWRIPTAAREAFDGLQEGEEMSELARGVTVDFVMPAVASSPLASSWSSSVEKAGLDLAGLLEEWGASVARGGGELGGEFF